MANYDIGDDEIRIIGSKKREEEVATTSEDTLAQKEDVSPTPPSHRSKWLLLGLVLALLTLGLMLYLVFCPVLEDAPYDPLQEADAVPTAMEESVVTVEEPQPTSVVPASLTLADTVVNDIALRIFTPQATVATLEMSNLPTGDDGVLLAAQAADVRGDKDLPAGTFVLNGELLAKSHSKYGFCAIIGNEITLGRQTETPFFERAIEQGGSFFRQYSLVSDGQMVDIPPKGKSLRRSLCLRNNSICIIESQEKESYHDFSQALADMGVSEAISLVGGQALLLYRTPDGEEIVEGTSSANPKKSINYIVFRK